MQSRYWIPALMLAGLFALQSTASSVQEAIGKATSVRPQTEGCPFRKSYPDVLVMQPCQDGNSDNGTRPSNCSTQGCIFL